MITQTELFKKCISVILISEGGFTLNPIDSGNWTGPNCTGELKGTKYGIAARFFPYLDIKNLTLNQARQIYFEKYYLPMNLEGIHDQFAILHIFDFGINAGKGIAIRTAQRIVGAKADGIMGKMTTEAINKFHNFSTAYIMKRKEYYVNLVNQKPQYKIFLKGWLNRVEKTKFA